MMSENEITDNPVLMGESIELIETEHVDLDPTLSEIHAMLGHDYRYSSSGKTDKQLLMEALEEQYCP